MLARLEREDESLPEPDPSWLKDSEMRRRRAQGVPGTDPVSLPDPVTKATLRKPQKDEYNGTLRERGIQKELAAAIINVSTGSLTQWVEAGSIRLTSDGFVPIAEVRRKIFEVHRGRAAVPLAADGDVNAIAMAKVRAEVAKGAMEELKFANASKEVVSRQAVSIRFSDMAAIVRTRLLSLPNRLADDLTGVEDRHQVLRILTQEITEALAALAKPFSLRREEENDGDTDERRRAGGSARKEETGTAPPTTDDARRGGVAG